MVYTYTSFSSPAELSSAGSVPMVADFFASASAAFSRRIFDMVSSDTYTLLIALSFILAAVVLLLLMRITEVRTKRIIKYNHNGKNRENENDMGHEQSEKPKRWFSVVKHVESDNPAEWRMAIIEADTILDDLVKKLGHPGANLGERLKAIDPADFETLDDAWEAHKVRNAIAHEGANFLLTHREARRVVGLYENVFQEFGYI